MILIDQIAAVQNVVASVIDNLALGVIDIVVFEQVFPYAEILSFDPFLGSFDLVISGWVITSPSSAPILSITPAILSEPNSRIRSSSSER